MLEPSVRDDENTGVAEEESIGRRMDAEPSGTWFPILEVLDAT